MRLTISVTYSESGSELHPNFPINFSESEFDFNSVFMNLDICILFILHLHSSK